MRDKFKPHVFVVDDEQGMLEVVSLILEQAEFECACFTRADDCLRHLRVQVCDLLVTDVQMPDIADILQHPTSTVESRRSDIMRKLDVNSVVDLERRTSAMWLDKMN